MGMQVNRIIVENMKEFAKSFINENYSNESGETLLCKTSYVFNESTQVKCNNQQQHNHHPKSNPQTKS